MGKLPYIPDKKLYAAVMGACSYIRETGWFNKACQYYADKYDVDVDDVKKYVRIAQGNGQKIANKKKARKYHWYVVEFSVMSGLNPYFYPAWAQYSVKKATSKDNAEEAVRKKYFDYGNGGDASYRDIYTGRIEEFDSEEEAKECAREWKKANDELISKTNGITGSAEGFLTGLDIEKMMQNGFFVDKEENHAET